MRKNAIPLLLLLYLILFEYRLYCQPPIDPNPDAFVLEPTRDPCEKVTPIVSYNNERQNVINLDCPDASTVILNIIKEQSFFCLDFCNDYIIEVYFGGHQIHKTANWSLERGLNIRLDPVVIANIYQNTGRVDNVITVLIKRKCDFYTWETIGYDIPIQIINSNDTYTAQFTTIETSGLICPQSFDVTNMPGESLCCEPSSTLTMSVTDAEIKETQIKFTGKVGGKLYILNFDIGAEKITKISHAVTHSKTVTLKGSAIGCKTFGQRFKYLVTKTQKFKADCDNNNDNDVAVSEPTFEKELIAITLEDGCEFDAVASCDPVKDPPKPTKRKQLLERFEDCDSDLVLEGYSDDNVKIEWLNGSTVVGVGLTIDNLPPGKYTVRVKNECCETKEVEFYNCETPSYDVWIFSNNEQNEWCRTVSCDGGPQREDCSFEECVIADEVQFVYENGVCKEKHFYKAELLGVASSSDPITEIKYDKITKICSQLILCNGTVASETNQPAIFGNWTFNQPLNRCERVIFCFNEVVNGELDTDAPETVFNRLSNLCEPICDNIPQAPYFPINPGFWSWTQASGCQKTVTCNVFESPFVVAGQASYPSWTYNQQLEKCESPVSCDFIPVPGATSSINANSYGEWKTATFPGSTCYRVAFCGENNVPTNYDIGVPTYLSAPNEPCPDWPFLGHKIYLVCDGVVTPHYQCSGGEPNSRSNEKNEFIVYPNPFTNKIHILGLDNQYYSYSIFDASNRIISKGQLDKDNIISTDNIVNGIYFIKIFDENLNEIGTNKIVKME